MKYVYNKGIINKKAISGFAATGALLLTSVMSFGITGASHAAKAPDPGVGGVIVTPAPVVCNPVSSLTYKGDPTIGELGFGQISVNYSVKPCDKSPVTVGVVMIETAPGTVVYENLDSPLSGRFFVNGVKVNTSYKVTVTVYDTTTGASVGSQTIFAAARTKPV